MHLRDGRSRVRNSDAYERRPNNPIPLIRTWYRIKVEAIGTESVRGCAGPLISVKRESKSKPDRGVLRNQIYLRNQKREAVLQCIANIFVARRPDANAPPAS